MYGFPCCTERVTNPDYDSEGNAYGKQGDDSCIIPKGCTKCINTSTLTILIDVGDTTAPSFDTPVGFTHEAGDGPIIGMQ